MEFTENILASAPDSYKCAFTCNLINSNTVKCMPNIPPQMWAMNNIAKLQSQHWTAQSYSVYYKKFSLVGPFLQLLIVCPAICRTKFKSKHEQFASLAGRSQAVLMASGDWCWLYANFKPLLSLPSLPKKLLFLPATLIRATCRRLVYAYQVLQGLNGGKYKTLWPWLRIAKLYRLWSFKR